MVGEINHVQQRNEAIKQLSPEAKAFYDQKVGLGADADATLTRAQLLDQQGINIFKNGGLQGSASILDPTGMLLPASDMQMASTQLGNVQGLGLSPLAPANDPHTYYITAVFDGTDDDFGQMLDPTNPGIFADSLLQTDGQQSFKIYEKVVGTGDEGPLMGGAFGLGG